MGFLDVIDDIEVPTNELVPLPNVYWFNSQDGRPPMFFVNNDYLADPPKAPWKLSDHFNDGKAASFVDATTKPLNVTVIGLRKSPFLKVDTANGSHKQFATQWQPGMQLLTEALCFVEGIDEPVIWSMRGMTGKHFQTEIVNKAKSIVLKQARQLLKTKRTYPLFTFALPIRVQHNAQGKIDFIKAGTQGGKYTPPALALPSQLTPQWLEQQFIGRDRYEECAELLNEYQAANWFAGIKPQPVQASYEPSDPEADGTNRWRDHYNQDTNEDDDDIPF